MKLTKDDLIKLLDEQMKSHFATDDFGKMVSDVIGKQILDLQNDVETPFASMAPKTLAANLPFVKIDGDFMSTKQGSIINLKNAKTPWVQVSDEVSAWAKDFANYLKTGAVSKLLAEGVDSAGGYLVPAEFRAIMVMYDAQPTLVWQRATVWPMSGEKLAFPKLNQNPDVDDEAFDHFAGVSFAWTEEGGEKEATEPSFGLVEMIAHELAGYTEITNTLLESSVVNLVNFLTRMFREAWYWYTDKEFIQGTGGKKPLGIVNDPSALTVNRQTASTVEVDDILNMEARMPSVFDEGSVFFITKKARAALRGQKVSANSKELVLQESFRDISDGYSMTLLGRPAVLADGKIPAIGNTGDVILGNWSNYYIGFPQDFSMDSSKHAQFRKNRTALRCSGRVDGVAAIAQAFVILTDPS
jgi:HK97 family phage major capsid protein